MAWVTEYDMGWYSLNESGNIYIQRDGGSYLGSLSYKRGSLRIDTKLPSLEDRIVRQNTQFTFVNEFSDFYTAIPLMTISNGQLRILVTRDADSGTDTLFQGFVNCEAVTQNMLEHADLTFTASGLLNKLKYEQVGALENLEMMSLIDVINYCLAATGVVLPVNVLCSLYELNHALSSGQTVFNKVSLFTEISWKDNIDRLSALELLQIILKSFNCYLYWWEEEWYIEHYEDLGDAILSPYQKSFVQYSVPASYTYASAGSVNTETIGQPYNIHTPTIRPQEGNSQKLSVMPGLQEVEVRLDQKLFYSLINGDLSDATTTTDTQPIPDWRLWELYDANDGGNPVVWGAANLGTRFRNISNCVDRQGYDVVNGSDYGNGMTSSVFLSIKEDTQLTVRWMYGILDENAIPGSSDLEDYTITFHYWMYVYNQDTTTGHFIIHNESAGTWDAVSGGVPLTSLNTVSVNGSDLDSSLLTAEVSTTINLGEAYYNDSSAMVADNLFCQICIGTEQWDDGVITPEPGGNAYFGDVTATISETPDDNILKGTQNVDFLDKKTVEIYLFDAGWSYRNTLVTGTNYRQRATDWGYDSASDSLPRWLLSSYFRLYNVARQKITMNVLHNPGITGTDPPQFRPMQIWLDNKQSTSSGDKPFVLTEDTYYPDKDMHTITLTEYDNTTEINLV